MTSADVMSWSKFLCEITMIQYKIRILIDAIFRVVIINMYITHTILHSVNYNLILFYEFATNRNVFCAELMRKGFQLGVLNNVISMFFWTCLKSFLYHYRTHDVTFIHQMTYMSSLLLPGNSYFLYFYSYWLKSFLWFWWLKL